MSRFINFSELYNAGGSFARQEVTTDSGTTVIYGGYAPRPEIADATDDLPGWLIRRLVVSEDPNRQVIQCAWARGSWTDRATLSYSYQLPDTPNMYSAS